MSDKKNQEVKDPMVGASTGSGVNQADMSENQTGNNPQTGGGVKTRPPRVDIPGIFPNPKWRFEVLYDNPSLQTEDARKDVFIEIRALITGEGDKLETQSRKWNYKGSEKST